MIKLGRLFNGRGLFKDINQDGMRLMCPQLFKVRTNILYKDYIGESLQFMIPSESITIEGVIAWVDLKRGERAIRINLFSFSHAERETKEQEIDKYFEVNDPGLQIVASYWENQISSTDKL